MDYLDFEVEVSPTDGGEYSVRVLRSPAGEASGTMRFPLDTLALENRLQALQIALLRSAGTRRRIDLPEVQTVQQFGTELWQALFTGDVLTGFEVSRNEARTQNAGLRLKLRLAAPELAALPWEYLYDAGRGDYLSLSMATPVVRYISLPEPIEPLTIQPPLRILGLIVSPDDLPPLDVQREKQRLEAALARLRGLGLVELEWLPGRTWRDLGQALRRGPWHIFHFIGHGGFDVLHGEGVIVLADDDGRSKFLSATDLGRFLGDHDPLRLAVLNSCDSARADKADVFSSTAAVLVRRGTPAVVAMQYEITDDAAIEFSRSFYEAIADGLPVDTAVAEARKGIAVAISNTLEWGTPVLFMRAADGILFRVPKAAEAALGDPGEMPEVPAEVPAAMDTRVSDARPDVAAVEVAEATFQGSKPEGFAVGASPDAAGNPSGPTDRRAPGAAAVADPMLAVPGVAATTTRRPLSRRFVLLGLLTSAVAGLVILGLFATLLPPPRPGLGMALSTDQARPGETVTISGTGFGAGETVNILIEGIVRTRTMARPDGAFRVDLPIPGDAGQFSSIEALGLTSGLRTNQGFTLRPAPTPTTDPSASPRSPATAYPSATQRPPASVKVSVEEAQPGDSLTVSGSGFDPGERVQISVGGILLDLATAGADGSFVSVVLLPNELAPLGSEPQVMLATAEGRESDRSASRKITIRGRSKFIEASFIIRLFIDPCLTGYVWRDAFDGDHVCVTPEHRDQAAQDNAAAGSRVDANGGYGPNSCVTGYVWREARPADLVCVTSEERARVAADNAAAPSRAAP